MDVITETIYDSETADLCYSLCRRQYIPDGNGGRTDVGLPERVAVCPGDFAAVEGFAPELLPVFQGLWSPEVIAAWKKKLEVAP